MSNKNILHAKKTDISILSLLSETYESKNMPPK